MDAVHTSLCLDHISNDPYNDIDIDNISIASDTSSLIYPDNYILPLTKQSIIPNLFAISDEIKSKNQNRSNHRTLHNNSPHITTKSNIFYSLLRSSISADLYLNNGTNITSPRKLEELEDLVLNNCDQTNYKSFVASNTILEQSKRRLVLDTPFSTKSTISYGLIVYAKDTQHWAIIQRKHSVEFLLFIRGLYRLTHLPLLLSCITIQEADVIKRCITGGPSIFKQVFLTELDLEESGLKYALIRMAESRNFVSTLLSKLDLSQNQLKWTWPKGRLQVSSERETPFACAKREFIEEVELSLSSPLFISDSYLSESIRTITGRNIESRYWIYVIPNEISMIPPDSHPEVSNRQWVSTDTCIQLIQHDTLFRHVADMIKSCH
jgi:ADP-ribose pyrophosphatase YjhB (NUDIX family)